MLFVSFFWAFFHSSLSPNVELALWPHGINRLDPWAIPLLGSCVLLASGFILTLGHHALILGNKSLTLLSLLFTVLLGALFLFLQYNEYSNGEFTIADSASLVPVLYRYWFLLLLSYSIPCWVWVYVLFVTTGLHALHFIAGVLFLTVGMVRVFRDSFTT